MCDIRRCEWANSHPLLAQYHDTEWGVPLHDDDRLFEFIMLDTAQAGLSWLSVLRKREGYRSAFCGFDAHAVAAFTDEDVERLLQDPGIIRNRSKVRAAVSNSRAFLEVQREFGTFDRYIWQFVGGHPVTNRFAAVSELPVHTPEAAAMSADLIGRGFRFVGPTTCYAFMQAAGLVNDHTVDCFRHAEVQG